MKINVDDLTITRCKPERDSKPHHKACIASKESLGDFLGWGMVAPKWSFQKHAKFLAWNANQSSPFNTFVAYYGNKFVGLFSLSSGSDNFGAQLCYWVGNEFSRNGVATEVTKLILDKAFTLDNLFYVQLHIDKANTASNRVAEKAGFHVMEEYSCTPQGSKGTGDMYLWIKYHPKVQEIANDDSFEASFDGNVTSAWCTDTSLSIAQDIFRSSKHCG